MKPAKKPVKLGDLQLRILSSLWEVKEATVSEIHEHVDRTKTLAYTTIATMLRKMEARKLVKHREEGRAFVYSAIVSKDEIKQGAASHFIDRLFEGSLSAAVLHLLKSREIDPSELDRLEKAIAEAKRRKK